MHVYDPAKQAGSPNYADYEECQDMYQPMNPSGPGGRMNIIENNEKGILETTLHGVIAKHVYDPMGSNHDAYKQGIYATNSVGDRD